MNDDFDACLYYNDKKYVKANLPESLKMITAQTQGGVKFVCFSQNVKSAMMWGHYAADGIPLAFDIYSQCLVSLIFSEIAQDICSSARWIFDGVAVATARKSNTADGQIDK